jgi:hypothetical protein
MFLTQLLKIAETGIYKHNFQPISSFYLARDRQRDVLGEANWRIFVTSYSERAKRRDPDNVSVD